MAKKSIKVLPEWLDLRFQSEDLDGEVSIRQYLTALLTALWQNGEGFSGKRPLGNSGWQYDLQEPLVKAGAIKGRVVVHKYGSDDESDWDTEVIPESNTEYENVVAALIQLMGQSPAKA